MSEAALTIPFSATAGQSTALAERFVHLEQKDADDSKETVTMYDIQQMVARAKGGQSALTYRPGDCRSAYIDGESLVINFEVYAWPSSPELIYSLTAGMGNISAPTVVRKDVEFSVTFGLSDVEEFDFIIEEITDYEWETECYDSQGRVVDDVTIAMDGYTTLRASAPIFGVVRIKAVKRGALHEITTRLVKLMEEAPTEEEYAGEYMTYHDFMGMYFNYSLSGNRVSSWAGPMGENKDAQIPNDPPNYTGLKLSNLKISVTSHWMDGNEEKTDQILLQVSQCIKDLLAMCDTDGDGNGDENLILNGGSNNGGSNPCEGENGGDPPITVYVSSCDGSTLDTRYPNEDANSWCGK